MDAIRIDLTGDRQVGLRFEQFPDALYDDLRAEIESLTRDLLGAVQASTPVATGTLRSQERMRVFTDPKRITGYVSLDAPSQDYGKAAALEYGAHKPFNVKPHKMKLDHIFENKLNEPITVLVTKLGSTFPRTPNIQAMRFERGPLGQMAGQINERLNAVVEKAVEKANA